MSFLFNFLYLLGLLIASPYFIWMLLTRREWRAACSTRLGFALPQNKSGKPSFWFHCCSVGEVSLASPLIKALHAQFPEAPIFVSTVTPTGAELVKTKYPFATHFYLPLDFSWIMQTLFCRLKPRLFLPIELEFWPNLVACAACASVPVMVVNGRMTKKSSQRYRWLGWFLNHLFGTLYVVARYASDHDRFLEVGVRQENMVVAGNLKDEKLKEAPSLSESSQTFLDQWLNQLTPHAKVLVAGSTHEGEEQLFVEALQKLEHSAEDQKTTWALILVPRHQPRWEGVAQLMVKKDLPFSRVSTSFLNDQQPVAPTTPRNHILLWDQIGELAALYACADLCFVGGSLADKGGHNLLEPAAHRKPVFFGPYVHHQEEDARRLIASGGGHQLPWSKDWSQEQKISTLAAEIHHLLRSDQQTAMSSGAQHLLSLSTDCLKTHLAMVNRVLRN